MIFSKMNKKIFNRAKVYQPCKRLFTNYKKDDFVTLFPKPIFMVVCCAQNH